MKQIPQFLNSLLNTPLLLTAEEHVKFETFINRVASQEASVMDRVFAKSYEPRPIDQLQYDKEKGIGVINVVGLCVDRYDEELEWWYGNDITFYEVLAADIQTMLDAGAHTIIQYNDSGGGMARGCFETSNKIRGMLDEKEAVMITYSDGVTASAAFAMASSSDEIVSNPDSRIGSVGVVISLMDTSKYMNDMGFKRIFITAGKGKVPYAEDGSFSEEYLEELQDTVDATYSKFTNHISTYRPVTEKELIKVGAKVFDAQAALDVGYADKIMTREEFIDYFEDLTPKGNSMSFLSKVLKTPQEQDATMSIKPEEIEAQLNAKLATLKEEMTVEFNKSRVEFEAKAAEKEQALANQVAQLEEALTAKEENEKVLKAESREVKLASFLGDIKAKELCEKFAALDDATFETMAGVLKAQQEAVAAKLEVEVGGEGEPVVTEEDNKSSLEAARAKAKASIEKQFKVKKV